VENRTSRTNVSSFDRPDDQAVPVLSLPRQRPVLENAHIDGATCEFGKYCALARSCLARPPHGHLVENLMLAAVMRRRHRLSEPNTRHILTSFLNFRVHEVRLRPCNMLINETDPPHPSWAQHRIYAFDFA
jgi:hypothetical protein